MEEKTIMVEIPNTKKDLRKALIKTLDTLIKQQEMIKRMEPALIKQDKTITELKATIAEQDEIIANHTPLAHEYVKQNINKNIVKDIPRPGKTPIEINFADKQKKEPQLKTTPEGYDDVERLKGVTKCTEFTNKIIEDMVKHGVTVGMLIHHNMILAQQVVSLGGEVVDIIIRQAPCYPKH